MRYGELKISRLIAQLRTLHVGGLKIRNAGSYFLVDYWSVMSQAKKQLFPVRISTNSLIYMYISNRQGMKAEGYWMGNSLCIEGF
jgi:hypothetical protein